MINKRLREILVASLIFVVAVVIYLWGPLIQGKVLVTTGLIHSDLMGYSYPNRVFYAQKLRAGAVPLWTKDVNGGFPIAAESQLGAFYPPNFLIFRLLPLPFAFHFSLALHIFLAGVFTFLLVREIYEGSFLAALFAGIAYSFSGFFAAHISHLNMLQVAAFFPLTVFAVEKLWKKCTLKYFLLLSGIYALTLLAGHNQLLYYYQVVILFYLLVKGMFFYQSGKAFEIIGVAAGWLGAAVLGLAIAGVQIFISSEFIQLSERVGGVTFEQAASYLYPLRHLLFFIMPWKADFSRPVRYGSGVPTISCWETYGFVGISTILLALTAIWRTAKERKKLLYPVLAGLLFSFLLAFGESTPFFELLWRTFPLMNLFQHPTRLISAGTLFLSVLGSLGLDWVSRPVGSRNLFILVLFAELYFFNGGVNVVSEADWWFRKAPAVKYLEQRLKGGYRFTTLGANNYHYRLIDELSVQKSLQNLLPPNFNLVYGLPSLGSNFGIYLRQDRLLETELADSIRWNGEQKAVAVGDSYVDYLSRSAVKHVLSGMPLDNDSLQEIRFLPFGRDLPYELQLGKPSGDYEIKTVSSSGVYLYENTGALPRARLAESAEGRGRGTRKDAEIVVDGDQRVVVEVKAGEEGYLVLADTYYPGWVATIREYRSDRSDRTYPAEILRANYNFRAVRVPAGESRVTFRYEPRSFKRGVMVSVVGIAVWVGLAVKGLVIQISRE